MTQIALLSDSVSVRYDDGLTYLPHSPIANLRRACMRIAASDVTVLLTGETGTGKEVFARLIHNQSSRARQKFVPVNCGAIPESLLESELFGFVRGAFTGAINARKGRVCLAEGGTLFLDEIGELPLPLQVKLLRLLQERTYEPVGSSESVAANFRLVAATNRDLEQEIQAGRFRRDLYYRLHVCPVMLPSLRERREDIPALFAYFWAKRGDRRPVSDAVLSRLAGYSWPGNVRELENLVERLSVCADGPTIGVSDLPPMFRGVETTLEIAGAPAQDKASVETPEPSGPVTLASQPIPADAPPSSPSLEAIALPADLPRLLRDLEDAYIAKALGLSGGNKKEAARLLGMGRTTLVEKLRRRNTDASEN